MIVRGHVGLGDQIYYRPYLDQLKGVTVATPWPELWRGYKVIREDRGLRTHKINADAQSASVWSSDGGREVCLSYVRDLRTCSIPDSLARQTGVTLAKSEFRIRADWDCPKIPGKVALFHPPTIRKEWAAPARNPHHEYMEAILRWLKDDGYTTVSIGHVDPRHETMVGNYRCDYEYMRGELHYTAVLSLIARADLVVSAPGFFVPACLALKARCLIVFGGHVPPRILIGDLAHDGWHHVAPSPFCFCVDRGHDCEKSIPMDRLREAYDSAKG